MRQAVKEYLELTEAQKRDLCKSATIVFDTNVLINLYRFSAKTRSALLKSMQFVANRIWIPKHVAEEFMRTRYGAIHDASACYTTLSDKRDKFINECIAHLRLQKESPEINELQSFMEKWLEKQKSDNLYVCSYSEDKLLEKLLNLFDSRVGPGFLNEELAAIKKEGALRYKRKQPPGYKDQPKEIDETDNNAYGDYIIWREILRYSAEQKVDIIFVTHDQKEDWWNIVHGKTIGPRVELRKEFYEATNQTFHMYNMNTFLEEFSPDQGSISSDILFEISELKNNVDMKNADLYNKMIKERIWKDWTNEGTYSLAKMDSLKRKINEQMAALRSLDEKYGRNKPENIALEYNNITVKLKQNLKWFEHLERQLDDQQKNLLEIIYTNKFDNINKINKN